MIYVEPKRIPHDQLTINFHDARPRSNLIKYVYGYTINQGLKGEQCSFDVCIVDKIDNEILVIVELKPTKVKLARECTKQTTKYRKYCQSVFLFNSCHFNEDIKELSLQINSILSSKYGAKQ